MEWNNQEQKVIDAMIAMRATGGMPSDKEFISQLACNLGIKEQQEFISIDDKLPEDYVDVLYLDSRDNKMHVGCFVWAQTPVSYVKEWMPLPTKKTDIG